MTLRKAFLFTMSLIILLPPLVLTASQSARATSMEAREGWVAMATPHSFARLVERVEAAAADQKIGVVTRASATVGAKRVLDMDIPGNMVIGLFHPRFAVRMLAASISAGIEAPIRVYLTENENGTTTLSYKTPSHVFAPYMDGGGAELAALASELDTLFAALAAQAAGRD